MPNTLLRKGLIAAMDQSIYNLNNSNNLEVKFTHDSIPDFSVEKSINLYRILQEIIHNTIKHADASELRIELKKDKQTLVMLTEDNGKGFDYSQQSKENMG